MLEIKIAIDTTGRPWSIPDKAEEADLVISREQDGYYRIIKNNYGESNLMVKSIDNLVERIKGP